MLKYDPLRRKYLDNDAFWAYTNQRKKERLINNDGMPQQSGNKRGGWTIEATHLENKIIHEFNRAKKGRGEISQLCGDLQRLDKYIESVKTLMKHCKTCKVYGNNFYMW